MNVLEVITAKRDGHQLTAEQIDWFITNYSADDRIDDEQAAALAMAIYLNGMAPEELSHWTTAMVESGETLDLSGLDRPTVDKHSTGGVGDKVSLILVPLVAACGAAVPQLSGRGLGHTGGTLDKMEAISGWRAQLTAEELRQQLATVGGVIAAATGDLAPADRKLYALRDATATIESIPLIASSIMSKKIAEGTTALTLDVKTGGGAFMTHIDDAILLAETMVGLGVAHGLATSALVTRMDNVLGRAVGNALEVVESIDVLSGGGPADLIELTLALADEMLALAEIDADPAAILASGQALEVFEQMVLAQGGDLSRPLPVANHKSLVRADRGGWVTAVSARPVGIAAWRLGAGRARKEDSVSPTAGVVCLVEPGEKVVEGQPLLEIHADDPSRFDEAEALLADAVEIADQRAQPTDLIAARITA